MAIYHNIAEYLKEKENYINTRWRLNDEGAFAFIDGKWVTAEDYYQNNSMPIYEPPIVENPDGTHIRSGIKPMKPR